MGNVEYLWYNIVGVIVVCVANVSIITEYSNL